MQYPQLRNELFSRPPLTPIKYFGMPSRDQRGILGGFGLQSFLFFKIHNVVWNFLSQMARKQASFEVNCNGALQSPFSSPFE